MQDKETNNALEFTDFSRVPKRGRIVALDLGTKKVGAAVSDELQITTRGVRIIKRENWKKFLQQIIELLAEFDAVALVLGLPLESDSAESPMSLEARRLARNFSLSIKIPVFLQDERVTTYEARGRLWEAGLNDKQIRANLDSEAAAIILSDFLTQREEFAHERHEKYEKRNKKI